MDFQEAWKHSN